MIAVVVLVAAVVWNFSLQQFAGEGCLTAACRYSVSTT